MTVREREERRLTSEEERCDVKVWSGECEHNNYRNEGEKYLCSVCGQVANLDHEMKHDTFPYLSGDKDFMS